MSKISNNLRAFYDEQDNWSIAKYKHLGKLNRALVHGKELEGFERVFSNPHLNNCVYVNKTTKEYFTANLGM